MKYQIFGLHFICTWNIMNLSPCFSWHEYMSYSVFVVWFLVGVLWMAVIRRFSPPTVWAPTLGPTNRTGTSGAITRAVTKCTPQPVVWSSTSGLTLARNPLSATMRYANQILPVVYIHVLVVTLLLKNPKIFSAVRNVFAVSYENKTTRMN